MILEIFALASLVGLPTSAVLSQSDQPAPQPQYPTTPNYPMTMAQRYAGEPKEVRLQRSSDGHYYANATIEGGRARVLIDTGATGVVISPRWLAAIGWDPRSGNYSTPVNTGGKTIYAHRFTLPEITVEGLTMRDVDAIVHPPGSQTPDIIGQSFLNNLRSVSMSNGEMILRG